jgi:hypothetical protein
LNTIDWVFISEIGFEVEPNNTLFHWPSAPDVKIEIVGKGADQRVVCLIGRKTQLHLSRREDVVDLVRLLKKGVADD